jgi:hypothetical protein
MTTALLGVAPNMKQVTGDGQCIRLTRIAVDVCRLCGIRAKPLAVTVDFKSHTDPEALIRLGFPGDIAGDDLWDGHLVCIVDGRLLLDLTIETMTWREVDLYPQPFCEPVEPDFLEGGAVTIPVNGGQANYSATPERQDFKDQPGWEEWPADKMQILAEKIAHLAAQVPV